MTPHTPALLDEVLVLTSPGSEASADLRQLADCSARIQTSLREANADSPTINSDPCVVLLTGEIGRRCKIDALNNGNFDDYTQCCDQMREWLTDISGKAIRARAADACQGGAVNLTPMARSLSKAVEQVLAEGGEPSVDPAIRLIAQQMVFITNTNKWNPEGPDAQRMRAMAQAQLARMVVDQVARSESHLRLA